MTNSHPTPPTADAIRHWIVTRLAEKLGVTAADIPCNEPLIDVGLDSMQFVAIVGELEEYLGCRFRDNPLIDYPTADALAVYLADQLRQGKTVIDPSARD